MTHLKGNLPPNTKKIRTLYCEFCKISVQEGVTQKMKTQWGPVIKYCPRCGGRLSKYLEGGERHTVVQKNKGGR